MLVPGARPRSIVPRKSHNWGAQWGIRPAGPTPGRPQSATKLSPNARGTTSWSPARGARSALLQPCEKYAPDIGPLEACRAWMGPGKTQAPVRDEGYNGESVSAPSERGTADDPVRVAFDAAEIGAWTWHIGSGRVDWTPRTYQLFGFEPGAVVPSYGLFLGRVHPSDRSRVMEWLTHAIRQGGRTALEFRIELPDGSIRRLRSAGRAMQGADREIASMAGIVEDVTDQQQRRLLIPAAAVSAPVSASFSARQVAHILGLAEASVKRLAEAGQLKLLRSTRKNSRRFAP